MIYDIIITLKGAETKVISLRIEAESRAGALLEANKKLRDMGHSDADRSTCSVRDAR
jgi:hypothetical protein